MPTRRSPHPTIPQNDWCAGGFGPGFAGGAQREGEGCAAIAVAVGIVCRAIGNVSVAGNDAADVVEVFANGWIDRDAQFALLESDAEFGKEFELEVLSELAEFDFAVAMLGRIVGPEIASEKVAKADAGAGVVQADALGSDEARTKNFDLIGGVHFFENEDFAGPKDVADFL